MSTEIGYLTTRSEYVPIQPRRGSGEVYSSTHREVNHQGYAVLGYCSDAPVEVLKKLLVNHKVYSYLDYEYGISVEQEMGRGNNGLVIKAVGNSPFPGCVINSPFEETYELIKDSVRWARFADRDVDLSKSLELGGDVFYKLWTTYIRMVERQTDKSTDDFAFRSFDSEKAALPGLLEAAKYLYETFLKTQPADSVVVLDAKIADVRAKLRREPQYTFFERDIAFLSHLKGKVRK